MSKFFYNGTYYSGSDVLISRYDRGLLLGDGIFETLLIKDSKAVFFEDHYLRLKESAEQLSLNFSMSREQVHAVLQRLLLESQLVSGFVRARITVSRGAKAPGLDFAQDDPASILIDISPYQSKATCFQKVIVSNIRRNEYSPLANIKSTNYLDNILAYQEAKKASADEALLLNTKGDLACATRGNVFLVKDQKIYTPSIESGILPGITRKKVIELCRINGMSVVEESVHPDIFDEIDGIFITNSLIGIQAVSSLDKLNFAESDLIRTIRDVYNCLVKVQ